jgi:hypothetical protein
MTKLPGTPLQLLYISSSPKNILKKLQDIKERPVQAIPSKEVA